MNDFETAARKAAEAIERAKSNAPDEWFLIPVTEMTEIITKHYASLAEVQGKLVELAAILDNEYPTREIISDDGKCYETYDTLPVSLRAILADPQISALIERKRE